MSHDPKTLADLQQAYARCGLATLGISFDIAMADRALASALHTLALITRRQQLKAYAKSGAGTHLQRTAQE